MSADNAYKSDTLKSDMLEYTEQPLTPKAGEIECKERCTKNFCAITVKLPLRLLELCAS